MSTDSIVRTDTIVLAPEHYDRFIDLLHTHYVPAATARGLELLDVAVAPGASSSANTSVVITWQIPDIATFWHARRAAMLDPSVEGFWKMTANLIVGRTRQFGQSSSPPSESVTAAGAEPLPPTGVHHLALLDLVDEIDDVSVTASAPVRAISLGQHLPGSVGGVDATCEFDSDEPLTIAAIQTEGANVTDLVVLGALVGAGAREPSLRDGIKRTLLLRVDEGAPRGVVAAFERDLLAMPRHIPAILNWRLSRVAHSGNGWTHAWEQEFADVSGLRVDYMRSPFHWGVVDGWFDAEDPRCIVAPELLHLFYKTAFSVLAPVGPP